MLEGLPIKHALEVGCNRGYNLMALADLFEWDLVGIDPNQHACELARASSAKFGVLLGHVFDLPFKDGYFDLVLTVGVLIHIALADLPVALSEIYRVSRRYILVNEYFAEEETLIPYHNHNDLLWKRSFLKHYQTQFPDLALIRSGHWEREDGFDQTRWWVLEKPASG